MRNGQHLVGGGPISDQEIEEAESSVGIKFESDYRFFVQRYGGANSVVVRES